MKVCIIGAGDGGAIAAAQIRHVDSEAQIDIFSSRDELGCPPCEIPLVIGGVISTWDELIRGFRRTSFWEKRNAGVHLNAEVTRVVRDEKYIVAANKKYDYDKLILALGATPTVPTFPGLDGKNEFALSTDLADGRALGEAVSRYRSAAIIGGGFIGLEIAAALKARGYRHIHMLVRSGLL
ncbi:MAG: FAD/NAD(P)-binding oxidoreductase, partial [Thermodesulfobacteriota bacterium]|nr:FAD/NAD(P)-binding oxidoreductase [Thermodesulfobacteriota bacterium]